MRRLSLRLLCLCLPALLAACGAVVEPSGEPSLGEESHALVQRPAGPRPSAVMVSGVHHTCALKPNGTIWCWGLGSAGELGNGGTPAVQTSPVQVSGITNAVGLTAGAYHTCAVLADSTVRCWGFNTYGQLGNGGSSNQSLPVQVLGTSGVGVLSGVSSLESGYYHTCALLFDGTARCWGDNGGGQLGDGTTTNSSTPVAVNGLAGAVRIAAGHQHSCAALSDGTARCWGYNGFGQLGDGTFSNHLSPVAVSGLNNVTAIAATWYQTCALQANGVASCWGSNGKGEVGDGTTTNRNAPVAVGLANVTQIAVGEQYACALLADGTARCWGANAQGQLGDGTTTDQPAPVTVKDVSNNALSNITLLAPGDFHGCALKSDSTVSCWGMNVQGDLGDGTTTDRPLAAPVVGLSGITRGPGISGGNNFTCALKANGTVACWGNDGTGQLGDAGNGTNKSSPVAVSGLTDAVALSASYMYACALRANGTVSCWGNNSNYVLGDGTTTTRYAPVAVQGLSNVIAISSGMYHNCALIADGTMKCWGSNYNGQLGDGTTTTRSSPITVPGLSNVVALSAAESQTCALFGNGTASCWGRNDSGQLGDGTVNERHSPVPVWGLSGAVALTTGAWHGCALLATGGVRCWGSNYSGQLGAGLADLQSNMPVAVSGLSNAVALSSNGYGDHTCAIRADGTAVCWGYNSYGECGDGTWASNDKKKTPVVVSGLSNVVALGVGAIHSCALRADGTAWCWGDNYYGELGIGSVDPNNSRKPSPMQVVSYP